MEVILLERVRHLGNLGDIVKVRRGFGRYLVPAGKALPANKANLETFNQRRGELEDKVRSNLEAAQQKATQLQNLAITIAARASEEGKLFGSIAIIDIIRALDQAGHKLAKQEVFLPNGPIRQIGEYDIEVGFLHREVLATIKLKIVPE